MTIRILLCTFFALLSLPVLAIQPPESDRPMTAAQQERFRAISENHVVHGFLPKLRAARAARTADGERGEGFSESWVVSGTLFVPVAPVYYSDMSVPPYESSRLQTKLFDGPFSTGTLADYYHEVSYGNLEVTGTVFDWARLSQSELYYEGPPGCNGWSSCGGHIDELITEAASSSDGYVDYGQYDNDGPDGIPNSGDDDGYVDVLVVVHPEMAFQCPWPGLENNFLTHQGWNTYETDDPSAAGGMIRIVDYVLTNGISCYGGEVDIGGIAHELGHILGLPDLYDIDDSSQGIGPWGLMGWGSGGGNLIFHWRPSHMSAWSKMQLGWVVPVELDGPVNGFSLPNAEEQPFAVKIPFEDPVDPREYFLLENRQRIGFDDSLQAEGLLIWHIDDFKYMNAVECVDGPVEGTCGYSHFMVALEQADGAFDLELKTGLFDIALLGTGDPFRAGHKDRFTASSIPWSRDYHDRAPAHPRITGISQAEAVMTLDLEYAVLIDGDGDNFGIPEDCDDTDPDVNPGATEIPGNGKDDDCSPNTPPWGTPASVVDTEYERSSGTVNTLLIFLPIGAMIILRMLRRKR